MPEWSVPPTARHIVTPPTFFNSPKQKDDGINNSANSNGTTACGNKISSAISVIHHDCYYPGIFPPPQSSKSLLIHMFILSLTIRLESYVLSQYMMGSEGAKQLPCVGG